VQFHEYLKSKKNPTPFAKGVAKEDNKMNLLNNFPLFERWIKGA
jgi:hypothetical protein